jgi:hypothetical protein
MCKTASGEYEAAIDLISLGVANRLPIILYLPIDPFLLPLHSDVRFQELMVSILK